MIYGSILNIVCGNKYGREYNQIMHAYEIQKSCFILMWKGRLQEDPGNWMWGNLCKSWKVQSGDWEANKGVWVRNPVKIHNMVLF